MRLRRRIVSPLARALLLGCALTLAAACGGASGSSDTPTPAPPTVTPTPEGPDLTIFTSFMYPIAGACLPVSDQLMPNAPRDYRSGLHEGVDFYEYDSCTEITKGTPALAAKDGVVIRADHDYQALTAEELATANERIAAGEPNAFEVIDLFRGRQVWIDHGKGIVTRYAHLSGIPVEIQLGSRVVQGETVGVVGDSGTPESISSPDSELHLHWELRAGETFLGAGLPPEVVRETYLRLFAPID